MGPSPSATIARLLASLAGTFDGEEPVDELTHALLCAEGARVAGARPALVTAALLHDVGRSPLVAAVHPGLAHERAGAAYLRPLLGDEVAWLVGQHVAAKAWLVANEPGYAARLSPASAASHEHQLGGLGPMPVDHPLWADALALRRLDDDAKDPETPRPNLGPILAAVAPLLRPDRGPVPRHLRDTGARGDDEECSSRGRDLVEEGSCALPTIAADASVPPRPTRAGRHLEV